MAFFDRPGPLAEARKALIGRPSLRRSLRDLPDERSAAIAQNLSAQIDPVRFKGLYRERLQEAINNENAAAPLNERDNLTKLLNDPRLTPEEREQANNRLKQLPGAMSAAARFDPRSPQSVAYQQYGSLYRDVR